MAGAEDFARLARRLKDAGQTGLRAELFAKISKAADPFMREVSDVEYLKPWMPDRYAEVLAADLRVTALKQYGASTYGVSVRLRGRVRNRQVQVLENGFLRHPVFADREQPRKEWRWKTQTGGMVPGFFSTAAEKAVPGIRDDMLATMRDVAMRITGN